MLYVWVNPKFMIMKKVAVLLFFAISILACTADETEMNAEINAIELDTDTIPPTHDKDWGKDEKALKGN